MQGRQVTISWRKLAQHSRADQSKVRWEDIPQNDLMIRAAFSHSRSRVAGQKASRWTRPLLRLVAVLDLLATLTLMLARPLVLVVDDRRFDHPNNPPVLFVGAALFELEAELEALLSHEGKKADTRCIMAML